MNNKPSRQAPFQSLVTFKNSQGDTARGTLLTIERGTVVFEVYNPYSIVQLSEVLKDLTIRRGENAVYQGHAVVSNLVNTGLILIVSANFIDPWVPEARVPGGNVAALKLEAADFVETWESFNRIRDGYRIAVHALRSYLSDLNHWMQRLEAENADALTQIYDSYDSLLDFASPLLEKLQRLNESFAQEAHRLRDDEAAIHRAFAQRELHPLIMSSPYPHRTFSKPLGYAGDYEMMNMIHRAKPEGPSPYAKLVNAAYVRLPIALSVRNRAALLEDRLLAGAERCHGEGRCFRVVSIGCGPAVEVQRFIANCRRDWRVRIDLIDFNTETLEHAQSRIDEVLRNTETAVEVRFIRRSVHSLLKNAVSRGDQGADEWEGMSADADFVYCAGLFDYLSDKVCSRLVRLFYTWLRADGRLLVTNMHSCTLNRYLLEHQADWFLIYRGEQSMVDMGAALGEPEIFTDETGINLSLEVVKVGGSNRRH